MLNECKVCLGEHDEEIHEATLGVRGWFHHQVTRWLEDETIPVLEAAEEVLAANAA
jgi:hypothetical protein